MSGEDDVAAVAALVEDATARRILIETRTTPMSAEQLSEHCDVSPSTVYRRLEELSTHDLVEERTRPGEDGHHHTVYAARVDRIAFEATDDGFELDLEVREPAADVFTRLVEDMGP